MSKFAWEDDDLVGVTYTKFAPNAASAQGDIGRINDLIGADFTDAPEPLYVARAVLNAAEIVAWAQGEGILVVEPDALHVTLAFSREPVDWLKLDPDETPLTLPASDQRQLSILGDTHLVLEFSSSALSLRHHQIRAAGASWDFPSYRPHVTLGVGPIPAGAKPYTGAIRLGPEVFDVLRVPEE